MSGLGNQAEQTRPVNNSPNINISTISEIEGLLEQVAIRLEKLRNSQGLTTQQSAAISALTVRVKHIVEENVVVTRRAFE